MQASTLGRTAALAALLALAGCGGKATFEVTGSFLDPGTGANAPVRTAGLQLGLNGDQEKLDIPVGATNYRFNTRISYGDSYTVKVLRNPEHMSCDISPLGAASGTAGQTTSIFVNVACRQNSYSIIGTVNNLQEDGLVLSNGATSTQALKKGETGFVFSGIPYGSPYLVAVTAKPASHTCTVVNGAGYMGEGDVKNVVVNCTQP